MEIRSVYRGARISAFKARELTREIQGLPASAALDIIAFSPKKAALMVGKTLKSAIANAENNAELKVDTLVVKEATVGEGPTMKRMKTRARGSGSTIRKRTAHIRIILSDEIELPQRNDAAYAGKGKKKSASKTGAATAAPRSKAAAAVPSAQPAAEVEGAVKAEPASQAGEGPGETHAPPKASSDEGTTNL